MQKLFVHSQERNKKDFDEEQIVMGEKLIDIEITFAQQLQEQLFKHINGFCSTLAARKGFKPHKKFNGTRSFIVKAAGIGH